MPRLQGNPSGSELYPHQPYGFERYLENDGNGTNALRTERLAQTRTLQAGDVLATGVSVLAEPREYGNGGVLIRLSTCFFGVSFSVPGRIPIALRKTLEDTAPQSDNIDTNTMRTDRWAQPKALQVGDILATGERVLSLSKDEDPDGDVQIHLSSMKAGWPDGDWIPVPAVIPIALLTKADNAPPELWELSRL